MAKSKKQNPSPQPGIQAEPPDESPTVNLNLWSFAPITTGQFCKLGMASESNPIAQMAIPLGGDPNQSLYLYNQNQTAAPAGGLSVKKKAFISMMISTQFYQPGTDSPYQGPFSFAGLTLVPKTPGAITDKNFSRAGWSPTRMQFHVRKGKKGGRWDLYISIIDLSTGELGLIDPEVENDVPTIVTSPAP